MRIKLVALTLLLSFQLAEAATIILVRHAERAGGTDASVPLSERGHQRARLLARMLAGSGIQAIYTTDMARTLQTAAPLAAELKIHPTVLPGKDLTGLLSRLQSLERDQVVLVIGHSNTVPEIVSRLGAATPPMSDSEFDRMLI